MSKETLHKIFPFLGWIGELKDRKVLTADIIAGLTVAFILIPQSMAYAQLAGLPITVGLYTAFIPVLIAGLFGSSRQMATGPVTIVSLMTATALATLPPPVLDEGYIVYASLLALFIGIFYIILGFLRLGVIVDFLSHPVIVGFTNAVAIITITSQAGKIFGISYDKGTNYFEGLYNLINTAILNTHLETFIYGIISISVLILLTKFAPKLPRVLILLGGAILASTFLGYSGDIVKDIPSALPNFSIPFLSEYVLNGLNLQDLLNLGLYAIIIGLIGFTESISVAKFVGTKTKEKVSANRELIGQGLANISSGLFQGYGVAGSFSKTAVNLRAGAKTGFSSVVTAIIVGITLYYLTPLLDNLPMVTLAAVIMVAVSDLIKIEPIKRAWRAEKHDGIVAITTFLITLILAPNIELGIAIGVVLSLGFYISRSMRPRFIEVSMYKDGLYRDIDLFGLKTSKHVSVLRFDGVLYFANASYFEDKILDLISNKKKLKYVILDLEWMADIDASGIEVLDNFVKRLDSIGVNILLSSMRVNVIKKLESYCFLKTFSKKYIFAHIDDALSYIYDKKGDDIDLDPLKDFQSKKKGNDEEARNILKKYVKK